MENQTQSPQPPTPRTHTGIGIIFTVAIILAIGATSAATYYLFPRSNSDRPASSNTNTSQPAQSSNSNSSAVDESQSSNKTPLYYYTTKPTEDDAQHTLKFYRASQRFDQPDSLIHELTLNGAYSDVETSTGKPGTVLVVANNESEAKVYAIDLLDKGSTPTVILTVTLNKNTAQVLRGVRYVDQQKKLAYITADAKNESAENSVLHVFDLGAKTETEHIELSKKSPLYAGFGFLATGANDNLIYLHETGGDGGASWSTWYVVNRTTKSVTQLADLPPKDASSEETFHVPVAFNPNGSKIAYPNYSTLIQESDIDRDGFPGYASPCLTGILDKYQKEGGTVMLMDLASKKTTELYRNLSYGNNVCMNNARRILTVDWIDESHIAFETVDGIYSIDTGTKKISTVYTFPATSNPGNQPRPTLLSISGSELSFSDNSLVDASTGKQLSSVGPTTFNATFFVSK